MSIAVFWIEVADDEVIPRAEFFSGTQLSAALNFCQDKRNAGHSHVCMSSNDENSVGRKGVDSVVDGKTPDGHDYTWMKRRNS